VPTVAQEEASMSGDNWVVLLILAAFLVLWLVVLPRMGLG
jgi:hypothetical protein